jgi:hypothetical protein
LPNEKMLAFSTWFGTNILLPPLWNRRIDPKQPPPPILSVPTASPNLKMVT